MGTSRDHRRYAEQCVVMARRAADDSDRALWLTLAQSWVRLAEHVARSVPDADQDDASPDDAPEAASAEPG